ncbi:HEPN domain-containing protein [Paraglaciecola hydrolytica]|uniref:HEPN domain-containing protein n=1 Tax=Paraglaciecola hydrolytica TaxID=1799789 RepID=A0A136A2X4_9ALTE|nr:hypothetical protein [Paraglaciecola hydrolytica]KXI29585.1 hypothetical protein AX660_05895 [Paraglaciecola hydrolytica]
MHIGETSKGFLDSAKEFLLAANLVLNKSDSVSLPSYFLLGRSIELSLKAYLLHSGISIKQLRSKKFGHDLRLLLAESYDQGLANEIEIQDIERGVIQLLSFDYAEKRLEYRVTGGQYALPFIDVTCRIATKLAYELDDVCVQNSE